MTIKILDDSAPLIISLILFSIILPWSLHCDHTDPLSSSYMTGHFQFHYISLYHPKFGDYCFPKLWHILLNFVILVDI